MSRFILDFKIVVSDEDELDEKFVLILFKEWIKLILVFIGELGI